jgi:anti-sigma regulatory factor (Ser/Thr protein kinase)
MEPQFGVIVYVEGGNMTQNPGWRFQAEQAKHAHRSRREFIEHLRRHGSEESDFAAAEIIYGELVANVMRHANGRIRILLEWKSLYALLRVRDYGEGFRHDFGLPRTLSETGRGLFIVRRLARKVDIECYPTGCEVRALLPVVKKSELASP